MQRKTVGGMRGPAGGAAAHQRLVDEVQLLHERLHRVTLALAITEELLADTFERMAARPSARSTQQRLQAKRARMSAVQCREFVERLDELAPERTQPPYPRIV